MWEGVDVYNTALALLFGVTGTLPMGENTGSCLTAPQDEVWSQIGEKSGKSPLGDFNTSDEKAGLCSSLLPPPSVASVM